MAIGGKGKGKGKAKKKKKPPKYDATPEGTSLFGVLAGHLLRTPLGETVTVLGVKYADLETKADPVLWVEHKSGLQAPLNLVPRIALKEQGIRILNEFLHLSCDVKGLSLAEDLRGSRTEERSATAKTFLQTFQGFRGSHAKQDNNVDTPCPICNEVQPRAELDRHKTACGKREEARERLRDAKPVVGVKVDIAEGRPGLSIVKVYPGGAFEASGIKEGAVLTHLNGIPIDDPEQFKDSINSHRPGDNVVVRIHPSDDSPVTEVKVTVGGSGLSIDEVATCVRLARGQFISEDYIATVPVFAAQPTTPASGPTPLPISTSSSQNLGGHGNEL